MQTIQPKRSKFKKSTKKYVQDNILDIIDIEETLLKNRFISKVQPSDFIYSKFLPKHDSLKPITKSNTALQSIPQDERISPLIENKLFPNSTSHDNTSDFYNTNKNSFSVIDKFSIIDEKDSKNLFLKSESIINTCNIN